jgi:hypothetical protein
MALVNQQAAASGLPPVGFVNPAVYLIGKGPNYTTDFHDITVGDNEWPGSPNNFVAVDGYDLCTGWGTPTPALITALAPGTGGGGACRPTTQPPQHDLCITRNARFWFTHGGTSYDNCATLLNAIAKNNTQFCLGFIALPANYENGDGVKDAVDALMEALSFYWKSKSYTGEAGGSQNQHLPACALCVARKKLAVELIAALANNTLLGTVPGNCTAADGTVIPTDLIPQAAAAAAGEDVVPIKYYTALLTKFNNSGLRDNFQGGLQECSPTPARFLAPVARDPTTQLNCPGINDDIPRAQAVFGFPFTTSVDLRLYHKDVPDPLCATTGTGADAVWKVLPPVAGAGRTFDVDTFGSNCDTVLWVLTPNGTMCSDNATPYSRQSQLTFTTDGINTYYIVAASKSGMTGKLKLNIHSY